ncbi:putative hydrolase or acyltransferase of alpha/beta superfamily [Saccharomonospora marina XMU15]|uniref:Putative hydrolase or acyltransferase of alpha/beta superfamily n=1 Tax=Saccharomonospora marina XMU15 TaxID=882083 RepID=H5X2G7_9PSEU|nr:putative hydrolase or acyltransferase of alpha/beta superfamily [Saccharomonospora marina XMU15]
MFSLHRSDVLVSVVVVTTMTVNGRTIGYDDEGSGPPLVLLHGHPFDRTMWRPQVERFSAEGWRVIAPDLRGYGESGGVEAVTPFEVFAGDVAELLDALGIDRFVLGGLSMGGQLVMECQRLFPERIRGLLLAATSPHAETARGRADREQQARRLLREGMAGYAEEVLPKMLAPHNIAGLPATARHVLGMMRATSPQGAAAALRGRALRPDYVAMLGRIEVPTLIVVGRLDEFTPVAVARELHEHIPNSTLAIIENAAHLPNLEHEVRFNDIVVKFLRELP